MRVLKPTPRSIPLVLTLAIVTHLSTVATGARVFSGSRTSLAQEKPLNLAARFGRLRRGVNLSHWFSQAPNYTKERLETHTTAADIALIKSMGFDHVRFPVEPAPLLTDTPDPSILNSTYLQYVDRALDMILAAGLAVVIDIHPSDEFKLRMNRDERGVEAFAKFWRAFASHLSKRDPEFVFLEVINEPMVEDGYRWYGIQGKLIAAIRAAAPNHTIIASGHRWSGLSEMLFLEPYADANVIYNFHFYEPFAFTHQGATWAGPNLPFYKNVPYPSSPEAVQVLLGDISDEPARYNLLRYGEDNWNAARIDRELGLAAAWAAKRHVFITCNEFGAFRKFARASDRVVWVRDMRVALEKHGIGWSMWDYAGGFAAVNKTNGQAQEDPELSKALGLK
jgi:aryl-phospho-beta-D-glucosidase BglC (GH1 family)